MSLIPHKHCELVIGIQTGKGVEAAGVLYKLPLPEGIETTNNKNFSFFQYSGGHYGLKHYETGGQWMEGTMRLPMIPGYVAATLDIYNWIWGRANAAGYYQGYWATVYRDMGNSLIERYLDVKVTGGSINVDFGAEYAFLDLNLTGINIPAADTYTGESEIMFAIRPYRFKEASLRLGLGSAGLAAENITRNHVLTWDNMTEAPADMGTLNGTVTPYDLPNNAKAQWGGTFDRLFDNTSVYDDFILETEGAYELTLARAAVATAVIDMPRIIYTEDPLPMPADGIVRENGIGFQALESLDGATDACTITET